MMSKIYIICEMIEGLIFDCPFGKAACDCPFTEIRKLTVKERLEVLRKLGHKNKSQLLIKHAACLRQREATDKEGNNHDKVSFNRKRP